MRTRSSPRRQLRRGWLLLIAGLALLALAGVLWPGLEGTQGVNPPTPAEPETWSPTAVTSLVAAVSGLLGSFAGLLTALTAFLRLRRETAPASPGTAEESATG